MSAQRYERISHTAADDDNNNTHPTSSPNSPPPSFRSRNSSISPSNRHNRNSSPEREHLVSSADRTLAETFDTPSDDDSDDDNDTRHLDDRQRVMSGRPQPQSQSRSSSTPLTVVERRAASGRVYGGGNATHDGVFANMSAKPQPGEEADEKPPTYEQAAADATPPYWENTILAPYSTLNSSGDPSSDVFIDGLPVGSLFSFVWNGMISMSFQLVGFLLTYLLHTSHAAKNGSKAGLGITLIQYGFGMRRDFGNHRGGDGSSDGGDLIIGGPPGDGEQGDPVIAPPTDPNSHDFDPSAAAAFVQGASSSAAAGAGAGDGAGGMKATDWFAYALMIVGWFVLIRSMAEYVRARRHEQLVLQSPARGLNVPVVAEGEGGEAAV
ncbi:MAG: hypothetical protein M1828_003793 [Chrysothrix sp. TS-e1954]|nr:MAG: hypothetical protein M1828_003793 [Chrysothrix sp. TS-e1954]